ncbi:dendritic cell-specific transmembrane protein [Oncorhynchus mykiss]|uniref:Dendritic cell-specific transmembrane protein-like domain-containing protein n=1 Tax=Oncorhynchus mykiss TaxID=8022 RepID=A0A8C7W648_ONCMY|nr:dendritic cell-specific transmembrane protein [Oncorhynchus mykiss]
MPSQLERLALFRVWSMMVLLYTSDHRKGWRHILLHFLSCLTLSLALGGALLLGLYFSLNYSLVVCGVTSGCCSLLLTAVLFCSKRVRCFSLLFLISCTMKQGRNLLLTAGTGLVILWNVQNTLRNLREVSSSLVCNLEKKRVLLDVSPINNYVNLLRWVGEKLNKFIDFGVVKYESSFTVGHSVESNDLTVKLQDAVLTLNTTTKSAEVCIDLVMAVFQRGVLVLGVTLVIITTTLFLRKYFFNLKYQNTFITSRFIRYDDQQRAEGKPYLLPLSPEEADQFRSIPSARFTRREGYTMLWFLVPVLTHLPIWLLFISLDALLYWLILIINKHLLELKPFSINLKMNLNEDNSIVFIPLPGGAIMKDFSYTFTLFQEDCLPQPSLLLSRSLVPLSVILVVLLVLDLLSAKMGQLKLLVSEQFYNDNADQRVQQLHAKISHKRAKTRPPTKRTALLRLLKQKSFWFPLFFHTAKENDMRLT